MYHFYFFLICASRFPREVLLFSRGRSSAQNYRDFEKKSISYFMNIMYKHIFLNIGVISFINKEIVSFIQLHTYKFGLVNIKFCALCPPFCTQTV